jgi:branched-chain amino acid transport system substrate-binding protein
MRKFLLGFAAALLTAPLAAASAADIKIGFIMVFTGPEAVGGQQVGRGVDLYVKHHPQVPGGHKLEILRRDTAGPAPDRAKRLAEELIVRDKVDMIVGLQFSPEAFAVMDVCKQTKMPMLILNAGTASIVDNCPYVARLSFTMWQAGYPMGEYAAKKMGIKTAAVAYANYAPGKDSTQAFRQAFEGAGGKVIADVPYPFPNIPDFTPFMQRIKDVKPDGLYVFVPAGKWSTGVMKTYNDLNMRAAGIKLIGPGDITQDSELPNMGDVPLGVVTVHHYSSAAERPENKKFVELWKKEYGADTEPDFFGVQGWDGMAAVYHVIEKTGGKIDGDSYLAAIKGWKYDSPRGPIMIDPATRDIVMNEYLSEVVKGPDGKLHQKVLATTPNVKDPCKELKVGPCGGG